MATTGAGKTEALIARLKEAQLKEARLREARRPEHEEPQRKSKRIQQKNAKRQQDSERSQLDSEETQKQGRKRTKWDSEKAQQQSRKKITLDSSKRTTNAFSTTSTRSLTKEEIITRITESEKPTTDRHRNGIDTWVDKYLELCTYKVEHQHTNVPQENNKLGQWVNKQRRLQNTSQLSAIRQTLLQEMNFDWGTRKGEHSFQKHLQELREFKQNQGHVKVPTKYPQNPSLGRWCSTMRKMYKLPHKKPTQQSQIEKLNALGFQWDASGKTPSRW